jgi:DNA-binding protein HU-beta
MKSIKKNEFAQTLSEKLEITKKQANDFMEAFVEGVTTIMKQGDKLNVAGLGIFKVADRPARMGRNPRTGESIHIKASKKVRFTASKVLKEAVLK